MTYDYKISRSYLEDAEIGEITKSWDNWLKTCGVLNTTGGRVSHFIDHANCDPFNRTLCFKAYFDSSTWTGAKAT